VKKKSQPEGGYEVTLGSEARIGINPNFQKGEGTMSSEEISRRKFIEKVAKYCGAGVAALGLITPGRAHAVADLDSPAQEGVWRMRDSQQLQGAEWRKNAPIPKDYFDKKPESLINGGDPVEWSHLHPNYYAEGDKSLVGLMMATPLDKDLKGDIKKAIKLVGGFEKSLKKSDRILIKPNMNSVHPWPGGGTDAAFLEALILVLKDQGYENLP
jgi:hypothetical protein